MCGKSIYRSRADLQKSKSKKYFCNKSCQTIWRNTLQYIGPRHLNWRGGFSSGSYRAFLRRASKEEVCSFCKITDKRVLVVHHKDRNHLNNRISNLMWLCHNCHTVLHRNTILNVINRAASKL
ncbi:MAG: HNH endonuclease [Candidatus Sungiibacteriota bacterium]|uniref:HNH endonuclease n=1 Tax=Candidatus Sungiibacteriota bacterium TaxID=2750080 RepID=A0A7T5UQV4_9BACT|nr:MAG: HNH endonuclease [Candidatus Sungbacteria bacterium]